MQKHHPRVQANHPVNPAQPLAQSSQLQVSSAEDGAPVNPSLLPPDWINRYCSLGRPGQSPPGSTPFPYQARLWRDPRRERIVLKSRQMGVSQALACEAMQTAITCPGSTVLLVSRTLDAARNLLRYARQCTAEAMASGQIPKPSKQNSTTMEWDRLESRVVSLAASADAARSYSATAVYLDEAAYLPFAEEIYQSLAPTVSQGGRMTVVSTPNGRGNLFHRLWIGATLPDSHWSPHRVHWNERPGCDETWLRTERARHTARSWAEEYELSFEDSGTCVFAESQIRKLLRPLPQEPGGAGAPPFFAGLDLARSADYTALAVLDSQGQLVWLDRFNQAGWTLQIHRVIAALNRFPRARVVCDATGVGDPVVEMLTRRSLDSQPSPFTVEPFCYTAESRSILMEDLVLAVEEARLWIPCAGEEGLPAPEQALLAEMRTFQWEISDRGHAAARHPSGGHDDCIQALALAWRALKRHVHRPKPQPLFVAVGYSSLFHSTRLHPE